MSSYYSYNAYGLKIRSEFPLPELAKADFKVEEVEVRYGKVPEQLDHLTGKGVLFQANEKEFIFRMDSIGAFYIQQGESITVEAAQGVSEKELRLFLLGSAMGALLHQRGFLPIHGSCISKGDKTVIISGVSGSGKSSLAAMFLKRGYRLLSDDIAVLKLQGEQLLVYPGYPGLKIWQDVLEKMAEDPGKLEKVRPQLQKFHFTAEKFFINTPQTPKMVVILSTKNSEGFEIKKLQGFEKFNAIKNQTFRYKFLEGMQQMEAHFKLANMLATQSEIYSIKRPLSPLLLEELAIEVEKLL